LPALDADDFVVIIGASGVGLAGVSLLKALTPAKVVAVDISSEKRAAALTAGADIAIDGAAENPLADIKRACSRTPRAVIDFVGMEKTARLGMDILGRSGHLIAVGLYGGEIPIRSQASPCGTSPCKARMSARWPNCVNCSDSCRQRIFRRFRSRADRWRRSMMS
jgi:D-arabinose 1-dehydrogenase-like Zn-dependent alcohol dehydrogenase